MPKIKTRASRADLLVQCTQSAAPDVVRIDQANDMAKLGSAVHAIIAGEVSSNPIDFEQAVWDQGLDSTHYADARFLVSRALRWWNEHGDAFPPHDVEVQHLYEDPWLELSATGDVVGQYGHVLHVVDWKSGRRSGRYYHQLRATAWCAIQMHPDVLEVHLTLVWLRDQPETVIITRAELQQWYAAWSLQIRNGIEGGAFSPGDHCDYCPRRHNCDGRTEWMEKQVAFSHSIVSPGDITLALAEGRSGSIVADKIAGDLEVLGRIAKYREEYRARLRAWMQEHEVTSIVIDADMELALQTKEVKDFDIEAGWNELDRELGGELKDCLSLSLRRAEAAVKNLTPRGAKTAAWLHFLARLEQCGGMTRREGAPSLVLQQRREPDAEPADDAGRTGDHDREERGDRDAADRQDGSGVA